MQLDTSRRQLEGKVALVTGAGTGIGKATALLLASQGARVGVLGLGRERLERTVKEIEAGEGEAIAIEGDIAEEATLRDCVALLVERWGRLDIVHANAGINGVWAPIEELTVEEWDQTINVNLRGTFLTIKHATPHLKKQGGSIIITSSVNGTRMFSNTGSTAYSATKSAQVAMTKVLALELAKWKVRVNVICPGWIWTNLHESTHPRHLDKVRTRVKIHGGAVPLTGGMAGSPHQVAQVVLFLASDASSHVTGAEIFIDGGQSLIQG